MSFPVLTDTGWRVVLRAPLALGILACDTSETKSVVDKPAEYRTAIIYSSDSIASIRSMSFDRTGSRLAIVSSSPPFIHIIDTAGTPLYRRVGRGSGPGDMRTPWSVSPGAGTEAFMVFDVAQRRLIALTDSGTVARSDSARISHATILNDILALTYGVPRAVYTWGPGIVVGDVLGVVSNTRALRSLVISHHQNGGTVDTIRNFATDSLYAPSATDHAELFVSIPLWAVCDDSTLVVFDPLRDQLEWIGRGRGTIVRRQTRLVAPSVSDVDRERYILHLLEHQARNAGVSQTPDQLRALAPRVLRQSSSMFAQTAPAAVSIICSDEQQAWLRRFATDSDPRGLGDEWVAFDSKNGPVRSVSLPSNFAPVIARAGAFWGILRDSLSVAHVARAVPYGSAF